MLLKHFGGVLLVVSALLLVVLVSGFGAKALGWPKRTGAVTDDGGGAKSIDVAMYAAEARGPRAVFAVDAFATPRTARDAVPPSAFGEERLLDVGNRDVDPREHPGHANYEQSRLLIDDERHDMKVFGAPTSSGWACVVLRGRTIDATHCVRDLRPEGVSIASTGTDSWSVIYGLASNDVGYVGVDLPDGERPAVLHRNAFLYVGATDDPGLPRALVVRRLQGDESRILLDPGR